MDEERLTESPTSSSSAAKRRRSRPHAHRAQSADHQADNELEQHEPDADTSEDDVSEMSDEEFRTMLELSNIQDVLPTLPKIPGLHMFWATSRSAQDTIAKRQNLGYRPVTADMLPNWVAPNNNTGEHGSAVMVNEMVAMCVPQRRYEMMMRYFHHEQPLRQEEAIRSTITKLSDEAEQRGGRIEEGDGMAAFGKKAPRPKFEAG